MLSNVLVSRDGIQKKSFFYGRQMVSNFLNVENYGRLNNAVLVALLSSQKSRLL